MSSGPPKRYRPRLKAVDLTVSDIACECHVWPVPRTPSYAETWPSESQAILRR